MSTVLERFLRYVTIDTQSDASSPSQPSTARQLDLSRLLLAELREIGLDATLDDNGYVYATIPANTGKAVPTICFCSHVDTAPDFSGTGVKPQIVRNYAGGRHRAAGRSEPHHPHRRLSDTGRPDRQ